MTMSYKDEMAAIKRHTERIRAIAQEIRTMSETWTTTIDDVIAADDCEVRIPTIRLALEAAAHLFTPGPSLLVSLNSAERRVYTQDAASYGFHWETIEPDSWLFAALARWVDLNGAALYAEHTAAARDEADRMTSYRYFLED